MLFLRTPDLKISRGACPRTPLEPRALGTRDAPALHHIYHNKSIFWIDIRLLTLTKG